MSDLTVPPSEIEIAEVQSAVARLDKTASAVIGRLAFARDAALARAEAAEARVKELESRQDTFNPVSQVYFRAGLLASRESLARFVESESPTIAASIRANWWPRLGDDPGPPRQFQWDEIAQENTDGSITHKPISPSVEAVAYAWAFLNGAADG